MDATTRHIGNRTKLILCNRVTPLCSATSALHAKAYFYILSVRVNVIHRNRVEVIESRRSNEDVVGIREALITNVIALSNRKHALTATIVAYIFTTRTSTLRVTIKTTHTLFFHISHFLNNVLRNFLTVGNIFTLWYGIRHKIVPCGGTYNIVFFNRVSFNVVRHRIGINFLIFVFTFRVRASVGTITTNNRIKVPSYRIGVYALTRLSSNFVFFNVYKRFDQNIDQNTNNVRVRAIGRSNYVFRVFFSHSNIYNYNLEHKAILYIINEEVYNVVHEYKCLYAVIKIVDN